MPFCRSRAIALSVATFPLLAVAMLPIGCGHPVAQDSDTAAGETTAFIASAPAMKTSALSSAVAAPGADNNAKPKTIREMPRKIIYTAVLEVSTTDFARSVSQIAQSVRENKGYIAETNTSGAAGELKSGTWKIRIPAERYDAFLATAGKIGEVANSSSTSEDVSEEFYDTEARLKNKRVEEARLLQHLQASTGKLSEILAVEREISRVREEIEQMEGRMRFLSHQADFTTITINLHELASLQRKPDAPSFGSQITQAFIDSLGGIGAFTKYVVLAIAYLAPWLLILAGVGIPIGYLVRKRKAR